MNIRTDSDFERILENVRGKLPNKNDTEIIYMSLKMLAVELGAAA
jgi:hypothetical protein